MLIKPGPPDSPVRSAAKPMPSSENEPKAKTVKVISRGDRQFPQIESTAEL
jgi:hypothetical protein